MSKIYTKFGDKGQTQMLSGRVLPKSECEAVGEIDALIVSINKIIATNTLDDQKEVLLDIIQSLFNINAYISSDLTELKYIEHLDVKLVEDLIDILMNHCPKLKQFIKYSNCPLYVLFSECRVITRKVERILTQKEENQLLFPWINRLSDLFFAYSYYMAFNRLDENGKNYEIEYYKFQ